MKIVLYRVRAFTIAAYIHELNKTSSQIICQCHLLLYNQLILVIDLTICLIAYLYSYSNDDRYLAAVADYAQPSLCVWRVGDYSHAAHVDLFDKGYIINDLAWSRAADSGNHFAMCGQRNLLMMCRVNEMERAATIRLDRINVEAILDKQHGVVMVDFTVVRFGERAQRLEDELLFAATSTGLVSIWNATSQACLLHWQADSAEIDALALVNTPSLSLFTGSTSGTLRLWKLPKNMTENKKSENFSSFELTLESSAYRPFCV